MKLFSPAKVADENYSAGDDDRGGNREFPSLSSSPRNVQSAEGGSVNCSPLLLYPAYLDEIANKLNGEDPSTRPLRRALGFMDILNKVQLL